MRITQILVAAVAAAHCCGTVSAQNVKPENQVRYRKAVYTVMNLSFGNLAAMAEGKKPFNKDDAQRHADIVALLSPIPRNYFGEGTDKDTRAKPEVWTRRADFDAKMDRMTTEAAKLPAAARSGDMAAFKKTVADVDSACESCHDEFRAKR